MVNSDVSKIVHATLEQMEAKGEVREDNPAAMGLKNTIVRNIAELEIAKEKRDLVLGPSSDTIAEVADSDHPEAA